MTKPACQDACVTKHKDLKNDYYSITVGPFSGFASCRPGQFVHLRIPSPEIYFRRAFSVAAVSEKEQGIEIIFKVFGRGTRLLSDLRVGDAVNILGPLGRPFTLPSKKDHTVMAAGGIGFPPLMFLAETMVARGFDPKAIHFFYGGQSSIDIIEKNRIKKLGIDFHPVTEDGTFGGKGLITGAIDTFIAGTKSSKLRIYSCGPEGMLKAVDDLARKGNVPGELALEAPMPCGIGICLGCVVPLRAGGNARVCCDGPVFKIGEVIL